MENRYLLFLHLCLEHVFCYSIQWHHYKDFKGELHCSAIKKTRNLLLEWLVTLWRVKKDIYLFLSYASDTKMYKNTEIKEIF